MYLTVIIALPHWDYMIPTRNRFTTIRIDTRAVRASITFVKRKIIGKNGRYY